MSKYLCYNGELQLASEATIHTDNRCFNYGDGIFETVRCLNSKALFFNKHYQRLANSLKALKIKLPAEYNQAYFESLIYRLLQRNRLYQGARVRITAFRNTGGLYTPTLNTVSFIITAFALETERYELAPKGLMVDIYTENKKPINILSSLKTCNSLFYIMAGLWKKEHDLDDCLILNHNNRIIEGLSSNIFLVKDKTLFATTDNCGCIKGTMQSTIADVSKECNLKLKLSNGFDESDLLNADEVLLTNAIQGVNYVSAYKTRRYYHSTASELTKALNRFLI